MTADRMAAFWDRLGPEYDRGRTAVAQAVSALAANRAGKRTLDLGCGAGAFSFALADGNPALTVGIDLSCGSLRAGCQGNSGLPRSVAFLAADMTALPFRERTFDLVWVWGSLHYVSQPTRVVEEMARVLTSRGQVVILTGPDTRATRLQLASVISLLVSPAVLLSGRRPHLRRMRNQLLGWCFAPGRMNAFTETDLIRLLALRGIRAKVLSLSDCTLIAPRTALLVVGGEAEGHQVA